MPKSCTSLNSIMKNQKINAEISKVETKQKERKKVKQYDALIRKKNQLLMKSK